MIRDFNPDTDLVEPGEVLPEYEEHPYPVELQAAPPDGVNADWTELHPNGAREFLGGQS